MSVSNELNVLAQVSSEIDESEVKLTFANQCRKAQDALANKLKEDIQRRKEICNFKKNENFKLEAEIKNAELEIENSRMTYETMNFVNTNMLKELLLTKEKKSEIQERIKKGEKKYEDLWVQCKKRYENIPLVKKLMQDKNKCETLKNDINSLDDEALRLSKAIKDKRGELADRDQKQIIQLAKFIVQEVPAAIKTIKEKTAVINNLTEELNDIAKEQEAAKNKARERTLVKTAQSPEEKTKSDSDWTIDASPMMPKLNLPSVDMDVINFKLDINKVTLHTSPVKRTVSFTELEKNTKKSKPDDNLKDNYISCYFNKTVTADEDDKQENSSTNYSMKKLINIIEDIKIDDSEAYKLMEQANVNKFREIDVITASKKAKEFIKSAQAVEIEEIEDMDLRNNGQQDLLVPPSQFLDLTQDRTNEQEVETVVQVVAEEATQKDQHFSPTKSSQEGNKKKVCFDLSNQDDPQLEAGSMSVENIEDGSPNETVTSQLDLSAVTDENYMAIKDMILMKKNQLDLSPQFVYAKNTFQKRNDDLIIKSKFFEETNDKNNENNNDLREEDNNDYIKPQNEIEENNQTEDVAAEKGSLENNSDNLDVDNVGPIPKANDTEKPVTGLLFTHGSQGIPDGLDISMSTTGYEEGDPDYPTCLDSSLLLSPKADMPVPMSGSSGAGSQDLPNFLSGFRKGGLSFFKQQPSDPNPDSNKPTQGNNFNFNFGSDDKKSRGGLFSFFR